MANLKEIKNRITSISSTMQITSAMKMVSAAKLKKAQDAITQMRPYSNKLQELLGNLSATTDISENPYSEIRQESNILVLAISSNRGLCGGFNNNVIKKVNELVNKTYANANVNIICFAKLFCGASSFKIVGCSPLSKTGKPCSNIAKVDPLLPKYS
jgi:F-type H+-transporting ATPase subunit gamma